jgi:hypothetical protein
MLNVVHVWVGRPLSIALSNCSFTRVASINRRPVKKQFPMCSLRALTYLQVQDLPRQGMVGPRSDNPQRREGETNGPQGQRPARVSRRSPTWTEFVRLADRAVVARAGTGMINRAEPRACGYSRGSRRLDTEPETEITAGSASKAAVVGCGRAQDDQAGFQPYWGKPLPAPGGERARQAGAVRNDKRGQRKCGQDLMAICHHARKGRHTGSHWSKPVALPLYSTRPPAPFLRPGLSKRWLGLPSAFTAPLKSTRR